MDKELVYKNMFNLIHNGYFVDKYIEVATDDDDFFDDLDIILDELEEQYDTIQTPITEAKTDNVEDLESISAGIFNAIIIGCQLFDDEERIKKFVDMFYCGLNPSYLERCLPDFGISKQEALNRLNHGFVVHFTTPKIVEEIKKKGKLAGAGKNAMFSKEEDKIISFAEYEQKKNNPTAESTVNYLFRGWGTGVSSYGSTTNRFWMYHTPESLTFLFGDISKRDKEKSMKSVIEKISSLKKEDQELVFDTMSNIYDRLVGEEQSVCCILIDRDLFDYEIDYYCETGKAVGIERRPFNSNFFALLSNDSFIKKDIAVSDLKFLSIPTIVELERQKNEQLKDTSSLHSL